MRSDKILETDSAGVRIREEDNTEVRLSAESASQIFPDSSACNEQPNLPDIHWERATDASIAVYSAIYP